MQGNFYKAFYKSKEIAFARLLILIRRYYLTFLLNIKINEFVKVVFLNIKMSHL